MVFELHPGVFYISWNVNTLQDLDFSFYFFLWSVSGQKHVGLIMNLLKHKSPVNAGPVAAGGERQTSRPIDWIGLGVDTVKSAESK